MTSIHSFKNMNVYNESFGLRVRLYKVDIPSFSTSIKTPILDIEQKRYNGLNLKYEKHRKSSKI